MATVIEMGKRTLEYNPVVEAIENTYPDDYIILNTMFTWEIEDALKQLKQGRLDSNKYVVIDGVGWRNAGNEGVIDLDNLIYPDLPEDQETQVTKITEGCPNNCEFCFSKDFKVLPFPEIIRNEVKLTDENLLAHPQIDQMLMMFFLQKVNNKVVRYEAICGFERRRITEHIAKLLKQARFKNIRFAWDDKFSDKSQKECSQIVTNLKKAGYDPQTISIFILTNWKVPLSECEKKLDLMKVWNVKVNDCCFNCCYDNPIPHYWSMDEIKHFRKKCREHNQIVRFKIFPEEDS